MFIDFCGAFDETDFSFTVIFRGRDSMKENMFVLKTLVRRETSLD